MGEVLEERSQARRTQNKDIGEASVRKCNHCDTARTFGSDPTRGRPFWASSSSIRERCNVLRSTKKYGAPLVKNESFLPRKRRQASKRLSIVGMTWISAIAPTTTNSCGPA